MQHEPVRRGRPADREHQRSDDPRPAQQRDRAHPVPAADDHDADLRRGEEVGHDRAAPDLAAHATSRSCMGKFLGALSLYVIMLAVTLIHFGVLFLYGTPEWKPIATAYLGLLLLGGAFVSVGLFISSLTKNQIVAGAVTFVVFLLLWISTWIGRFRRPDRRRGRPLPLDHRSLRRLQQGRHRHDAPDLLSEFHHLRLVPHGQVGRQRALEGLIVVNRILNIVGWLGTALVLAAVAIRFGLPQQERIGVYLAWAGLAAILLYLAGQWREIAQLFARPAGALRHAVGDERPHRARHPGRHQLHRSEAEQALGLHGEPAVQPVRPDRNPCSTPRVAAPGAGVRARHRDAAVPRPAAGVSSTLSKQVSPEFIDTDKNRARADENQVTAVRHHRAQLQGPHRARHDEHRAGHHQRHHQGRLGRGSARSTSPRATARRTPRPPPIATATT